MSPPSAAPALLVPPPGPFAADAVMNRFVEAAGAKGLELYPEQEEAILDLYSGNNVILNTPTGSGKSLVAAAFHFKALCSGERSVYTCPIKALVNEKFLSLCREFGAPNVGMMTGDASVNPDAPILCCTAEILANMALARGDGSGIRAVVMDEFHFYGDSDRGSAWQVPLLVLARARFLLMSATLGATRFFEKELEATTGAPTVTIRSDRRPVPLEFEYSEIPLMERVEGLIENAQAPVYLVHFTQRSASEAAQSLMSLSICSKEEKSVLQGELEGARFNSPYGREIKRWLRHGIGLHHAGLLPKYRLLVESLAQRGLLKVICGTDTLGVGINVPIRTVLFTQLWKYDGKKSAILSVRDFRQISGRAGRKGFDDRGLVVVQAPEHAIENKRLEEKALAGDKKSKKAAKQRPPEGSVSWDRKTFDRLLTAPAEEINSRFDVNHGMLLLVLGRDEDGCRVMRRLIDGCHESPASKRQLKRRAWQLFQSLLDRGIIERIPTTSTGRRLRVNVDLQSDFSLHQSLSLYLLDAVSVLDRASPDYAFDVLTLCEAIVEDPEQILRKQVDKLKGEKIEQMKAEGMPYEERMAKLEEIEHPKPLREFLYETFNAFAAAHPWVEDTVRPKSIAREMYERYQSFSDYVREYEIQRSEGVLLRHLSQAWKVLAQTVPDSAKTEEVREMEDYLRELIRGVDSSLIEEWERLNNPGWISREAKEKPDRPSSFDVTRDTPSFRRLVRTAVLGFLQEVSSKNWQGAASRLHTGETTVASEEPLTAEARLIEKAFGPYLEAKGRFRLDPEGRSPKHTHWDETSNPVEWTVLQVLVDPQDLNDWEVRFDVSLEKSRSENRPVLTFASVRPVDAHEAMRSESAP